MAINEKAMEVAFEGYPDELKFKVAIEAARLVDEVKDLLATVLNDGMSDAEFVIHVGLAYAVAGVL